jgi:hypothetical protein
VQRAAASSKLGLAGKGRAALIVLLLSTLAGLFFSAQIYYTTTSLAHAVSWPQALYWGFGDWYEWALLSPLIFFLCRRWPFDRRSWPKSLVVHALSGVTFASIHAVLCAAAAVLQGVITDPPTSFAISLQGLLVRRGHFNLAVYAVIVCAWHAWDYHRKYRDREAEAADLNMRLARAQLEALRMQLNPHFLFNTLNAISGLMLNDVNAANKMLTRLGELLRLTLEARDQQEVSLAQELKFLNCYLEIQRIRFGNRLNVAMDIEPTTLEARVPNLVLQPIAENAIRHTMEPPNGGGEIRFRTARENGSLLLEVVDHGEGLKSQNGVETWSESPVRHHIGLVNTRERLQKLYGVHQSLALKENPEGGVTVSIRIPFRPGDRAE